MTSTVVLDASWKTLSSHQQVNFLARLSLTGSRFCTDVARRRYGGYIDIGTTITHNNLPHARANTPYGGVTIRKLMLDRFLLVTGGNHVQGVVWVDTAMRKAEVRLYNDDCAVITVAQTRRYETARLRRSLSRLVSPYVDAPRRCNALGPGHNSKMPRHSAHT